MHRRLHLREEPGFCKKTETRPEKAFGDEYALFLTLMGEIRKRLLGTEHAPEAHKPLFETLIQSNLLEMIKNNDKERINGLLSEVLGSGYDYDTLISAAGNENALTEKRV